MTFPLYAQNHLTYSHNLNNLHSTILTPSTLPEYAANPPSTWRHLAALSASCLEKLDSVPPVDLGVVCLVLTQPLHLDELPGGAGGAAGPQPVVQNLLLPRYLRGSCAR